MVGKCSSRQGWWLEYQAEISYPKQQVGSSESELGMAWRFEISKPTTSDVLSSARSHFLDFLKSTTNWKPQGQMLKPMWQILIQTTTDPYKKTLDHYMLAKMEHFFIYYIKKYLHRSLTFSGGWLCFRLLRIISSSHLVDIDQKYSVDIFSNFISCLLF